MHMVLNVTVIYCLCEILLLLENSDTHCLSVEVLNLDRLGCHCIPYMLIYRLTMKTLNKISNWSSLFYSIILTISKTIYQSLLW